MYRAGGAGRQRGPREGAGRLSRDPVLRIETGEGHALRWVDRWLLGWLEGRAQEPAAVLEALEQGAPSDSLSGLSASDRALLRLAHEVSPVAQLRLQACFQAHVDGAVSKTVHLSEEVQVGEIVSLIHRARELGCKGVAFWRHVAGGPTPCVRCAL